MDHLPQLTITDLIDLQQVVDTACTRGAFKAAEMKQIGTVYETLITFLDALKTQIDTQQTPTELPVEAGSPPQGD